MPVPEERPESYSRSAEAPRSRAARATAIVCSLGGAALAVWGVLWLCVWVGGRDAPRASRDWGDTPLGASDLRVAHQDSALDGSDPPGSSTVAADGSTIPDSVDVEVEYHGEVVGDVLGAQAEAVGVFLCRVGDSNASEATRAAFAEVAAEGGVALHALLTPPYYTKLRGEWRDRVHVVESVELAPDETEFRFGSVSSGWYFVAARGRGGIGGSAPTALSVGELFELVEPNRATTRVELQVGVTLAGRVTATSGEAIAGAQVEVFPLFQERDDDEPNPFVGFADLLPFLVEFPTDPIVADAGGEFRLPGLADRLYRVRVTAPPWAQVEVVHDPALDPLLEVVLEPGGELGGVVRDADGNGVESARVWIERDDRVGGERDDWLRRRTEVRTDAEGHFRFVGLARGDYRLRVQSKEHAPANLRGVHVRPGEAEWVEIGVDAGLRIAGTVKGSVDEMPIHGARLTLRFRRGVDRRGRYQWGRRLRAQSAGDGKFEFTTLAVGEYRLEVEPHDGVPTSQLVLAGDEKVEVVVDSGEVLAGEVVDGLGRPIDGARVRVSARGMRTRSATSSGDGAFAVHGVEGATTGSIRVTAEGYALFEESEVDLFGDAGTITLDTAVAIFGVVLDPDGAPVVGARVFAEPVVADGRRRRRSRSRPVRTDSYGEFRVELPRSDGEWRVRASAPERVAGRSESLVVRGVDLAEVEVRLAFGATVQGEVIDRSGYAIPDATLSMRRKADGRGRPIRRGRVVRVRGRGDGYFRFAGLLPGEYQLEARAPGFARSTPETLHLDPDVMHALDVILDEERRLEGVVVDRGGAPIAGARIRVLDGTSATSHRDGRFEVAGLPPGPYRVRVAKGGFRRWRADDVPESPLLVQLDDAGMIWGSVTDARTQQPIAGAHIVAVAEGGKSRRPERKNTRSDVDGAFRIEDLSATRFRVEVRADRYRPVVIEGTSAEPRSRTPLEVELLLGAEIVGEVLARNGDPIAGANVMAWRRTVDANGRERDASRSPARVRSEADGTFALTGLAPGNYRLLVRHAEFVEVRRSRVVVAGREVAPTFQRLVLESGGAIEGSVLGASGPIRDGVVEVIGGEPRRTRRARVDDGGGYRVGGLPAGEYEVRFRRHPRAAPSSVRSLRLPGPQRRVVDLRPGR